LTSQKGKVYIREVLAVNYHCIYGVIKMKFFAVLFLFCGIVGFAMVASTSPSADYDYGSDSTTEQDTTAPASDTTLAPLAQPPCGSGPQGPCGQVPPPLPPCVGGPGGLCGKKLYFFY